VNQLTLRFPHQLSELQVLQTWFVERWVEIFCQCVSLELRRPLNPDDTKRDALDKELFHRSARLVLALELPTQGHVAALVINFADPFRGKPMFACILVVGDCRQLIILRHAEPREISNCPAFD
jgi:hypothetical protein